MKPWVWSLIIILAAIGLWHYGVEALLAILGLSGLAVVAGDKAEKLRHEADIHKQLSEFDKEISKHLNESADSHHDKAQQAAEDIAEPKHEPKNGRTRKLFRIK